MIILGFIVGIRTRFTEFFNIYENKKILLKHNINKTNDEIIKMMDELS